MNIQSGNAYTKGQLVKSQATFTDGDGNVLDPTTVTVQYESPTGTVTTKVYVTDVEVVKSSTGVYYININANEVGRWYIYWSSTGTGQAAKESAFRVCNLQMG